MVRLSILLLLVVSLSGCALTIKRPLKDSGIHREWPTREFRSGEAGLPGRELPNPLHFFKAYW